MQVNLPGSVMVLLIASGGFLAVDANITANRYAVLTLFGRMYTAQSVKLISALNMSEKGSVRQITL